MAQILNIATILAENNIGRIGRDIDLLQQMTPETIAAVQMMDSEGMPVTGYEAIKHMIIHLSLIAEAVLMYRVAQMRAEELEKAKSDIHQPRVNA